MGALLREAVDVQGVKELGRAEETVQRFHYWQWNVLRYWR